MSDNGYGGYPAKVVHDKDCVKPTGDEPGLLSDRQLRVLQRHFDRQGEAGELQREFWGRLEGVHIFMFRNRDKLSTGSSES